MIVAREQNDTRRHEFDVATPEEAAALLGKRYHCTMLRQTGSPKGSGVWQGYRMLRDSMTSYGQNWHIG